MSRSSAVASPFSSFCPAGAEVPLRCSRAQPSRRGSGPGRPANRGGAPPRAACSSRPSWPARPGPTDDAPPARAAAPSPSTSARRLRRPLASISSARDPPPPATLPASAATCSRWGEPAGRASAPRTSGSAPRPDRGPPGARTRAPSVRIACWPLRDFSPSVRARRWWCWRRSVTVEARLLRGRRAPAVAAGVVLPRRRWGGGQRERGHRGRRAGRLALSRLRRRSRRLAGPCCRRRYAEYCRWRRSRGRTVEGGLGRRDPLEPVADAPGHVLRIARTLPGYCTDGRLSRGSTSSTAARPPPRRARPPPRGRPSTRCS